MTAPFHEQRLTFFPLWLRLDNFFISFIVLYFLLHNDFALVRCSFSRANRRRLASCCCCCCLMIDLSGCVPRQNLIVLSKGVNVLMIMEVVYSIDNGGGFEESEKREEASFHRSLNYRGSIVI